MDDVFSLMQKMDKRMDGIEDRINVEVPSKDEFKTKAKQEDIERVKEQTETVPPEIKKIIEEILGNDFGIEVENYKDRVGMRFSVIVPQRLSLLPLNTRPVVNDEGEQLTDDKGNLMTEEYYPQDKRSKSLTSVESYDLIREHCEKIKKHIVITYQKLSKPLPSFTK